MKNIRVVIGCDHGGFEYKNSVVEFLKAKDLEVEDLGTFSKESVDYPEIAKNVCKKITEGKADRGILICGSGIGMSIVANKQKGIRAALCSDMFSARVSREHNNSNVLCMGQRVIGEQIALEIVDIWMKTEFEGGRHQRRVDMME